AADVDLAAELGHSPDEGPCLRDAVAVTAVGGGDPGLVGQAPEHPDADRLLAGVEVDEAGDATLREDSGDTLLEGADQPHPLVDPDGPVPGELHGVSP